MTDTSQPVVGPDVELSQEITVKTRNGPRTIIMKFGLLREIARAFPDANSPQMIYQVPELMDTMLDILLVPRTATGRVDLPEDSKWTIDDEDLQPEDALRLVQWGVEHLMSFFLKKFKAMTEIGQTQMGEMEALLSSSPGLRALVSKKQSAGLTDVNTPSSEASTGGSPIETYEPT